MWIQLLIYLLLFVVPLIVIPGLSLRFEPPKVLITEFLIQALLVYVILTGKFTFKKASKPLFGIVVSLFLLSLLHLILSPTEQNLFGNIFRLQGTIFFWHLLILALIAQNTYFRLKDKYIYLTSFLGVCLGALIFGSNSAGRWIGSLGEPNALGAVIILISPFVFLNFRRVWVKILAIIMGLGVINFTQSVSAFIALGLQLLFLTNLKLFKGRVLPGVIICSILIVLSLLLPIIESQYRLNNSQTSRYLRFEDRTQIWQTALMAGFHSPVYGSGLESIQDRIYDKAKDLNFDAQYQVIDSSHNIFLDYWIWGGIIGLGLFGALVILGMRNMIQKKMILELTVFLGLLTVLSFNPTTVSVLAGLWWIMGRSFAKFNRE